MKESRDNKRGMESPILWIENWLQLTSRLLFSTFEKLSGAGSFGYKLASISAACLSYKSKDVKLRAFLLIFLPKALTEFDLFSVQSHMETICCI